MGRIEPLDRRTVLKSGAVAVALPWLEAMESSAGAASGGRPPKRFVAACYSLGFMPTHFFPKQPGRGFAPSPYSTILSEHCEKYSLIGGLNHAGAPGGHSNLCRWLTAKPQGKSVSLDQLIADRIGQETRFSSFVMGNSTNSPLSYDRNGVAIPLRRSPAELYRDMFISSGHGTEAVKQEVARLQDERSLLDTLVDQAKSIQGKMSAADQRRMVQYFEAIRQLEQRLHKAEKWASTPKPQVSEPQPPELGRKDDLLTSTDLRYDIIALALQTDSTRVISLTVFGARDVYRQLDGVREGHHPLSHHGREPGKIAQLEKIEGAFVGGIGRFLQKLDSVQEGEGTVLDHTTVLAGSNLGNASNHSGLNFPIVLAGGPYQHGYYHRLPENREPFANLHLSILHGMGFRDESWSESTGPLSVLR